MWRWSPAVVIGLLLAVVPAASNAQSLSGGVDLFEFRSDGGRSLLFDGSLSYGSDGGGVVAKLVVDGGLGRKIDQVEGELDYSLPICSAVKLETGVRHEFQGRLSYVVAGLSGEPSAGFALESYALASRQGAVFAEFKAVYNHSLARRVTLQPRLALNMAAQDVPYQRLAAGFVATELGIRIRYEQSRPFAPYAGISHERLLGRTAQIARKAGEASRLTHFVIGFSSAF